MTVLSDSSPLITLAKIGYLDLLRQLYTTVIITPEVFAEINAGGAEMAGASQIAAAKWIEIRPARKRTDLASAQQHFGLGIEELSIIMLGQEVNADVVLIDDMKARKSAQKEGLVVGLRGCPSGCIRPEIIANLVEAYRRLLASGAYVDRALLESILKILNLPPL